MQSTDASHHHQVTTKLDTTQLTDGHNCVVYLDHANSSGRSNRHSKSTNKQRQNKLLSDDDEQQLNNSNENESKCELTVEAAGLRLNAADYLIDTRSLPDLELINCRSPEQSGQSDNKSKRQNISHTTINMDLLNESSYQVTNADDQSLVAELPDKSETANSLLHDCKNKSAKMPLTNSKIVEQQSNNAALCHQDNNRQLCPVTIIKMPQESTAKTSSLHSDARLKNRRALLDNSRRANVNEQDQEDNDDDDDDEDDDDDCDDNEKDTELQQQQRDYESCNYCDCDLFHTHHRHHSHQQSGHQRRPLESASNVTSDSKSTTTNSEDNTQNSRLAVVDYEISSRRASSPASSGAPCKPANNNS